MTTRTAALTVAFGLLLPLGTTAPAAAAPPAPAVARAAAALSASTPERRRRRRPKKRAPLIDRGKRKAPNSKGAAADGSGASPADSGGAQAQAPTGASQGLGVRRSNRMEFDARLVQGERPKAGAVYLFERSPRRLPPLVKLRQSYVREIVVPVLGVDVWRQSAAAKHRRGGK